MKVKIRVFRKTLYLVRKGCVFHKPYGTKKQKY